MLDVSRAGIYARRGFLPADPNNGLERSVKVLFGAGLDQTSS